jgi:hypothetical protein
MAAMNPQDCPTVIVGSTPLALSLIACLPMHKNLVPDEISILDATTSQMLPTRRIPLTTLRSLRESRACDLEMQSKCFIKPAGSEIERNLLLPSTSARADRTYRPSLKWIPKVTARKLLPISIDNNGTIPS